DQVGRRALWSPRAGAAFLLNPKTKIAASASVAYARPDLNVLTLNQEQAAAVTFFDESGTISRGPITARFDTRFARIRVPRSNTFSGHVERELRPKLFARVAYIGRNDLHMYLTLPQAAGNSLIYYPRPDARQHYYAFETVLRQERSDLRWLASYT